MWTGCYPLVSEVVGVDVLQGDAHQVRRDVGKDPGQLLPRLQVGPGPGQLHIAQVLRKQNTTFMIMAFCLSSSILFVFSVREQELPVLE